MISEARDKRVLDYVGKPKSAYGIFVTFFEYSVSSSGALKIIEKIFFSPAAKELPSESFDCKSKYMKAHGTWSLLFDIDLCKTLRQVSKKPNLKASSRCLYKTIIFNYGDGMELYSFFPFRDQVIIDYHFPLEACKARFTSPGHRLNAASGVYTFGVMANAAVCGFEMVRQDGTKIEGIVKEKQEAKREYGQAVNAGHTASLVQQETADVFSIAVGNILPSETVTINLRYIQPLIDDEKKDQIKFIFPRTYAQRYGAAPTYNSGIGSTTHQPFQMNAVVQQAGAIKNISCPSGHPISFELGIPENLTPPKKTSPSHFATVSLTDTTGLLTQDAVLVISAAGLDGPRCFIERHPSPNHESVAMALTLVPKFNLPDVSGGMEYIFLVDRSGSMSGINIQVVREALVVLLRGLPSLGTTFNIVSFGSKATKLWENSQTYSQMTLEEATNHVDSMKPNYGGTQIAEALRIVYDSLPNPLLRPVAILLLTDGKAWDVSTCVEFTRSARAILPEPGNASSFIRVFAVSIGNGASSDTCDSIARAGDGMAVYVKQGEAIVGKCARLVKAARTPEVKVEVDWGVQVQSDADDNDDDFVVVEESQKVQTSSPVKATTGTISLFANDDSVDNDDPQQLHPTGSPPKPNLTLPLPPPIQQAPLIIPSIFPETRTEIYAILRIPAGVRNSSLPVAIKIKGFVTTTDDLVKLVVPVSSVLKSSIGLDSDSQPTSFSFGGTFLHTLAARALIRDREQGKHAFPPSVSALFEGDNTKAKLEAVSLEKDIVRLGAAYGLASKHTSFVAVDPREQRIIPVVAVAMTVPQLDMITARLSMSRVRQASSSKSRSQPSRLLQACDYASPSLRPPQALYFNPSTDPAKMKSVNSRPRLVDSIVPPSSTATTTTSTPSANTITPMTGSTLIAAVARFQQWRGGFLLNESLLHLLGDVLDLKDAHTHHPLSVGEFEQRIAKNGVNRELGATLVVLLWMEKYGREEVLDMKEKAIEWVNGEVGQERAGALKKGILGMLGVGTAA
ncbi:hypothetical protein BT96DRAFT_980726 [Gymnopus androsaceus JB14]|uniref:VIT-domain-containing protein n=1 Tax=Gymnopus androsaceus JB14 TaxID=1447944 RepID=A0A6A4GWF0_9AGAR|nr:hypothetical protein BT96DRAFT_980726 [Gymnopus androsaceus JB14]